MYLSTAKIVMEKIDTANEMVEMTLVARHINSPKGQ